MDNLTNELDRKSFKPLYVQLAEILIDYTKENHLKHGDPLPSENELLSHFSVSRNTIRLAVDRLVQLGIAQKLRGQGTFFISQKNTLPVHYHHAFEGSVELIGLKVTNKLIDNKIVSGHIDWLDSLGSTHWDDTVWIRRIKLASDELLAVEERLLPDHVVRRFSQDEIENQNISPDLVEKYPDTQTNRFNYIFMSQPLTKEESRLLKRPPNTPFLRRIGEYFNSVDERFMISRLTVISDRINLRYEYLKQAAGFVVQG
jgi:GntR family transcriptional regulator